MPFSERANGLRCGVLVGREEDLRDLSDLLGDEPLVLLKGGWGVGKSALLRALCQRTRKANPDLATYLVDASGVSRQDELVVCLAEQMLLATTDASAVQLALREQPSVALLIDECDAIDAEACAWLEGLAKHSPGATLVCAARSDLPFEALRFDLPALRTETGSGGTAGELVERLEKRRGGGRRLRREQVAAIAQAAHGNPRTIRLAVGLLGVLTPEQLLEELRETSKGILLQSAQGEAFFGRFEGLQWPQLDEQDRALLALLAAAVQLDRTTLEALSDEQVHSLRERLDRLGALSLVSVDEERIESYPLINQAVARLDPNEYQQQRRRWHGYLSKCGAPLVAKLEDPSAAEARDWFLERESELRRVVEVVHQGSSFDVSLAPLLLGLAKTLRIVGRPDSAILRGLSAFASGALKFSLIVEEARTAFVAGNWEQFVECAEAAASLASASPSGPMSDEAMLLKYFARWWKEGWLGETLDIDSPTTHPELHGLLGGKATEDGDFASAEQHYRLWLEQSEKRNLGVGIVMSSLRLSDIQRQHGHLDEAEACLTHALNVAKRLRSPRYEAMLYCDMAELEVARENYDTAMRYAESAERTFAALGHAMLLAGATWLRADIHLLSGHALDARTLLNLTASTYRRLGLDWQLSWVALRLAFLTSVDEGVERALAEFERVRNARATPRVTQDRVVFEVWCAALQRDTDTLERYVPADVSPGHFVWREALIARRAFDVFEGKPTHSRGAVLRLADDYSWFELVGAQVHRFRRETPMRRIASELFRARSNSPGEGLSAVRLSEVGWPNDRSSDESLRNRLWVTVSRLRGLGLDNCLQSVEEGYRIDPRVELEFV